DELVIFSLELLPARRQRVLRPQAQQLLSRVSEKPAGRFVDVHHAHRRAVDDEDHVRRVVERNAETAQIFLAALALGDVLRHADVADAAAELVNPAPAERYQDEAAVAAAPLRLEVLHGALRSEELTETPARARLGVDITGDAADAGHHGLRRFEPQHAGERRI